MMVTMKEAVILKDMTVVVRDVSVPKPAAGEVLVEVIASGSNPKDFKTYLFPDDKFPINNGDDIAGIVAEIGEEVTNVKPGDRVIAYHAIATGRGSWARYAVAPAYTVAPLADSVSYEAGATVPLAVMTAAMANYLICRLPEPDSPATSPVPFLVYGASSAVGAFSVKLAALSNVHPIIAVAGNGVDFVKTLLDSSKGDRVIDYRGKGADELEAEIKAACSGVELKHAFDAVALGHSPQVTVNTLAPNAGARATIAMPPTEGTFKAPEGIFWSIPNSTALHSGLNGQPKDDEAVAFGTKYFPAVAEWLNEGKLAPHPHELVPGGLLALEKVLNLLKDGKASAIKYVFRPSE